MKDYHDLITMLQHQDTLDGKEISRAVKAVFEHRKTPLQLPLKFDEPELKMLQTLGNGAICRRS